MNCCWSAVFIVTIYCGRLPPCYKWLSQPRESRRRRRADARRRARSKRSGRDVGLCDADGVQKDCERLTAALLDAAELLIEWSSAPREWWDEIQTFSVAGFQDIHVKIRSLSAALPRLYVGEWVFPDATFEELYFLFITARASVDGSVESVKYLFRGFSGRDALTITSTKTLPVGWLISSREAVCVSLHRWLDDGRWVCSQLGPMSPHFEPHMAKGARGCGLDVLRRSFQATGEEVKANIMIAGLVFEPLDEEALQGQQGQWKVRTFTQADLGGGVYDWMVALGYPNSIRDLARSMSEKHVELRRDPGLLQQPAEPLADELESVTPAGSSEEGEPSMTSTLLGYAVAPIQFVASPLTGSLGSLSTHLAQSLTAEPMAAAPLG